MSTNHPYLKSLLAVSLTGAAIVGCSAIADNFPQARGDSEFIPSSSGTSLSAYQTDDGDIDPTIQSYTATLDGVNEQVTGSNVSGTANFEIVGGTFNASVNATGLAPNVTALQHIHEGARCPTVEDDINGDGWIDAVEEAQVSGQILVPLDDNLASQSDEDMPMPMPSPSPSPGPVEKFALAPYPLQSEPSPSPSPGPVMDLSGYPVTDASGAYTYSQTANLEQMLADLRAEDPDPTDSVTKIEEDESLNLGSRVVIVHGVAPTTPLPPTVQSIDGLPAYLTVPVACGPITSTSTAPSPSPSPAASPGEFSYPGSADE